jgi:hypothetical protein
MSSVTTVVASLLGSSLLAAIVSAALSRVFAVDNRLWNARVNAYSRLLGKLLSWNALASQPWKRAGADLEQPRTDFNWVRAQFAEGILLATDDLRKRLEDFATTSSELSEAIGEINRRPAGEVDVESSPEWKRFWELRQRGLALRDEIADRMRCELDTERRLASRG